MPTPNPPSPLVGSFFKIVNQLFPIKISSFQEVNCTVF
ncbi:hypothetical protein KP78_09790 [Jeotgalibacillus soli]|uniref:Uncharacterized protein n=1 Tax=Jeotgalibacillus soli TaxID=889306 RepID=A0A0C2VYR1_9BACL|nr:hypothetical protein KP78_09790 [Jeotgalibacillus soli]